MPAPFRTLARPAEAELRDRGSRFLARAVPVGDRPEADGFIAAEQHAHRDASHVAWAFRLHDGAALASDAGEPAGSAGPPLLAAIDGAGLLDVAAVCVRWFGGTKLGVGGLVRAYGGALAEALAEAPTRKAVPALRLAVAYAYPQTAAVLRVVQAHGARHVEHEHRASGALVRFVLPLARGEAFAAALRDATRGELAADELGHAVLYER